MPNAQIGSVEIISFRTTRFDPEYKYPIEGALFGTSVSHLSLRLSFKDTTLFNKYIAGNPNIPYVDDLVTETGEPLYEVYFSFWPVTPLTVGNIDSRLNTHVSDCQESALGSPMTYVPRFNKYIHPDQKLFSSMIPILNLFLKTETTLPPAVIFHSTHFKTRLDKTLAKLLPLETASELAKKSDTIIETANSYCRCLKILSEATIARQSLINSAMYSSTALRAAEKRLEAANADLQAVRKSLKEQLQPILFKSTSVSDADFEDKLEDYLSFGKPEMDSVTLPLITHSTSTSADGLELEPMLVLIKEYADNPHKYQYNLFSNNCATVANNILQAGTKNARHWRLRNAFTLPWYVRLFDLPVSPAMVMELASSAQNTSSMRNTPREFGKKREQTMSCAAIAKPRISLPQLDSEYILTGYASAVLEGLHEDKIRGVSTRPTTP